MKLQELENVSGKFKGIQGHYNSCYLDATLFAMFTFTCVFDSLLFRPAEREVCRNVDIKNAIRLINSNHFKTIGHCKLQ